MLSLKNTLSLIHIQLNNILLSISNLTWFKVFSYHLMTNQPLHSSEKHSLSGRLHGQDWEGYIPPLSTHIPLYPLANVGKPNPHFIKVFKSWDHKDTKGKHIQVWVDIIWISRNQKHVEHVMWKLVISVHGAATGCPDADGGALLVYHKPAVYLKLQDLKR